MSAVPRVAAACIGVVLFSAACSSSPTGAPASGIVFTTDTVTPMMVGTTEYLSVNSTARPLLGFSISDGAVLKIAGDDAWGRALGASCCPPTTNNVNGGDEGCSPIAYGQPCPSGQLQMLSADITVSKVGTARLAILGSNSEEVDAVTLSVAAPAALTLSCAGATQTIRITEDCVPYWTAVDASGATLRADAGVHLTSSNPTVASFGQLGSAAPLSPEADGSLMNTALTGLSAGSTVVTATAGSGVTATMNVEVTP